MKESAEKAPEILNQEGVHEYFVNCTEQIVAEILAENEEERMRTNQPMTSPNAPMEAPIEPMKASMSINGAYISYSAQHNNIHRSHQIAFPEEGREEIVAEILAENEEERMRTNQPMTSPNAATKAPIEPMKASMTINGAYISYSAQHNNIHRSHQIAFPEEEGGLMMQETHMSTISTIMTTMTASGTSNGVYISSPIQHTNILRSHQLFFTAMYHERLCDNDENNAHHDHDFANVCEALKSLSNSPMPLNCFVEQMIYPASRFAFVTRQLSKHLGEPFWHF
jgi:predicted small secreted protein